MQGDSDDLEMAGVGLTPRKITPNSVIYSIERDYETISFFKGDLDNILKA